MIVKTREFIPMMLSRQPLFYGLDAHTLGRLAEGAFEQRVEKNTYLYQKGDLPQGVYLLVTGQVKLTLPSESGTEKVAAMIEPGDTFGEEAVLIRRRSPVSAEAIKDSILLVIERGVLQEAMADHCQLATAMLENLSARLCNQMENMETCVQRGSLQRVAHFFSQQAPQNTEQFALELAVDKQTIASQLNLAPETFSRVLRKLSSKGLIAIHGRNITLHNVDSLRAMAA